MRSWVLESNDEVSLSICDNIGPKKCLNARQSHAIAGEITRVINEAIAKWRERGHLETSRLQRGERSFLSLILVPILTHAFESRFILELYVPA